MKLRHTGINPLFFKSHQNLTIDVYFFVQLVTQQHRSPITPAELPTQGFEERVSVKRNSFSHPADSCTKILRTLLRTHSHLKARLRLSMFALTASLVACILLTTPNEVKGGRNQHGSMNALFCLCRIISSV